MKKQTINSQKMKNLLLLLLLFTGITNAQVVNIPDPNLLAALINPSYITDVNDMFIPSVDINFNGQIEVSEAIQIGTLFMDSANITDLTGMQAFVNLQNFGCDNNQVTSIIPLQNLTTLRLISLTNNPVTSIDLSAGFTSLTDLSSNSLITYLNLSGCSSLISISNLNMTALTYLNVNGCNTLNSLVTNAPLTFLDFTGCNSLQSLNIQNSQLTSINITNLNVPQMAISYNSLLTNLTVANCPNLNDFNCIENKITTLDLSGITTLNSFWVGNNSLLETLFIKNGRNESTVIVANPNLLFICADDSQIAAIQTNLISDGNPNAVCNSYCDFTPGGDYNTIRGSIKFDLANNGCDAADLPQSLIRININSGLNQGATFTNALGNYTFYVQTGNFTISPDHENPTWFNFTPISAVIPFANNNNNTTTQNFCITANGVHPDLEIVVAPILFARPGFDAVYQIAFKNKGNQTLSGTATFNYNDAVLDFVTSSVIPSSQSVGVLNWNYTNLLPFENRNYYVTLNVNAPTETPPVNIDDILNFTASITPLIGDEFPLDNSFSYNQTVVGSFDPNDITCIEGANLPPTEIGKYLHYIVNFENTGNFQAQNVVVANEIDTTQYDINSLQLINTSNPGYIRITGNKVEFIFENINLAAAMGNPPVGGHGNVLYKIKSKNNLVINDSVLQSSKIFFDYNFPIATNDAETTFTLLKNSIFEFDLQINVFPNPTTDLLTIESKSTIKSVELFDIQGRIIETTIGNLNQTNLNISKYQNGVYFVKINTESGSNVEKIIKE